MKLLEPYPLGPLTLPNRLVMAPMTRSRAPETLVGDLHVAYYVQRASAGLIITEGTQISPEGVGYIQTPGIHSDEQVAAWRRVTDAVHDASGRIFAQLWHVGRISHPSFHGGERPVAPSAVRPDIEVYTAAGPQAAVTPRSLETDEIPRLVADFRRAAEQARRAGFDGVEIHGANGYLLDQFLASGSNRRTDRYGGSVGNRARLLLEVTDAVTEVWGAGRVGVRLSPAGSFNDLSDDDRVGTYTYAARALGERDLAYLHVVEGTLPNGRSVSSVLREVYPGTLIAAGDYDRAQGEAALEEGRLDLVGYARLFLANPDLPRRFAEDAPLNTPDPSTFYGGDERGYTDYPVLENVAETV